jgi:transcriptional regulator with XRE-family HTH domain
MQSPFQFLRERAGLSQSQFCAAYGFSPMPLKYTEAGVYPHISERFEKAIYDACLEKGVDVGEALEEVYTYRDLQDAYHFWQSLERSEFGRQLAKVEPPFNSAGLSPFESLVWATAPTFEAFAKRLKVPPGTVIRYALGRVRNMPPAIRTALHDADYPYTVQLEAAQLVYREAA